MGDDQNRHGVNEAKHGYIPQVNDEEIGVQYRVHNPNHVWREMKHEYGEFYDSPSQLRYALINYAINDRYKIYIEKTDRFTVIARSGNNSNYQRPCPFSVAPGWKYH